MKMIKKLTTLAAALMMVGNVALPSMASAEEAKDPVALMASFVTCMEADPDEAAGPLTGFVKDADFWVRLVNRTSGGVEVPVQYETKVIAAIKANDDLRARYSACRVENGLDAI